MAADNGEPKTRVRKVASMEHAKVVNGDNVKIRNKFTEKEVMARQLKKYATTTFGFNSRSASSAYGSGGASDSQYGNFYSPQLSTDFLEKPQNQRERRAWYRHFYYSNEFVGQALDLHSTLPLSKIRLEKPVCQNPEQAEYVYSYFTEMCDEFKLFKALMDISHEFNLIGNCIPGDVYLRTIEGFKKATDIQVGDQVLTHKGRWGRVTKLCSRESEEDIFNIAAWKTFISLRVTKEHPVEVYRNGAFVFVPAGDVTKKDFVRITWPKNIIDIDSIDISNFGPIEKTPTGYNRKTVICRKRAEQAAIARKKFVEWITSLKEPIVKTRKDLVKELGISLTIFNSLIFQIGKEVGKDFHKRIGAKGYQKGSQVIWYPVSPALINSDDSYTIHRDHEYVSPHRISIDNDFAYLAGYWLGDGTLGTDHSREKEWGRGLWQIGGSNKSLNGINSINRIEKILIDKFGKDSVKRWVSKGSTYLRVTGNPAFNEWWSDNFGRSMGHAKFKKVPQWVIDLPIEKLKYFLAGLVDSDGSCSLSNNKIFSVVEIGMVSKSLMDSIREVCLKCGIVVNYHVSKDRAGPLPGGDRYTTENFYRIDTGDEQSCRILTEHSCKKLKEGCKGYRFFGDHGYFKRIDGDIVFKVKTISKDPGEIVYNFEVEGDHTYQANGFSTHNCFITAEDHEPYEAKTEAEEAKVAEMKEWGKKESHRLYEQFKIIDKDPNYKGWRKLIILPPDQVRIKKVPMSDDCLVEFIPDPETRKAILNSLDPIYSQMTPEKDRMPVPDLPHKLVSELQKSGSIPLDTDPYSGTHVYHFARKKSQYEVYGVSMLERCVNTLLLHDKLRQAQTQIATRHMTPIRVVWAEQLSEQDVESLRDQIDMALVDPDFSVVANYEVHWNEMGSNGRLLELAGEYEHIENSLFAGLGVTREILTGEGTYSGNKVTLEIMNTQYLLFRELLQEYVENNLFKPVARKKGFVEKDKYGREKLIYPKLSFSRLAIRDNDSFFEQVMQLYNKGSVSIDVILDMLNIDPASTKKKIEADLFSVNDFAFNQFMTNLYVAAATDMVQKYNVNERLATYLDLEELPQPPAEGAGGEAGGGLPPMPGGRFSSAGMDPKRQAALSKLVGMVMKSPEKLDKIASLLDRKK